MTSENSSGRKKRVWERGSGLKKQVSVGTPSRRLPGRVSGVPFRDLKLGAAAAVRKKKAQKVDAAKETGDATTNKLDG